ncbi:MAG: D-tyrosyl-tRNA(Tyr) deacylase [Candidatus Zixiibacteriota bacterium]|nr:MAG: D-tyrosyl-tRNA(Tyr) deacylase [candidate division Zixibacteria bacterium]
MRVVVQRTDGAELAIDGRAHSRTGAGLLVLFGTRRGDEEPSCVKLADKVVNLRIFEDEQGKMNLSALDIGAEIMIVSQFTLYADTRKGRRPAFTEAQEPEEAERLYERFVGLVRDSGLRVGTGKFGARMDIRFNNTGPVTIIIDHDL